MIRKSLLLLTILLSTSFFLKGLAFLVPDFAKIGKDPEIISIEPPYLIPGNKVKIIGKNFFELPKSANKVYINGYPLRVISAKENILEVKIPKFTNTKNAKINLVTEYLGYRSKGITFPKNGFLAVTFNAPKIKEVNTSSISPNTKIIVYGIFNNENEIFFKVNDMEIKGNFISKNECEVILPDKLETGPFNIYAFYRKYFNRSQHIDSAPSNKLVLFNTDSGNPLFIRIDLNKTIFNSLKDSYPYKVLLFFSSGKSCDITDFSKIFLQNENIFELNRDKRVLSPLSEGNTNFEAKFIWLPTNTELSYVLNLSVDLPKLPDFHEVIIDEVFPFASGFIKETDANMDSFPKTSEDEFIEFKNLTNKKLDLSNCEIFLNESDKSAYKFDKEFFIEPLSYLPIFSSEKNKLNLSNSGSVIEFKCADKTIDYTSYLTGKNGDPSWQRKEDLSGFIKHPLILFSPGEAPPKVTATPNASPSPLSTPGSTPSSTPVLAPDSTPDSLPTSNDITEILVMPDDLTFSDRNPIQIQVFANYTNGDKLDITQTATYKVNGTENIISISNSGLITPIKNGSVTIEINYQDKTLEIIANVNLKSLVQPKQLIINEIIAAPTLDTNKDGIFKSDQDEFIEIVNISGASLDISDLLISDNTRIRHTLPPNTILQDLEPIVIFGGGNIGNFSTTIKSQIADNGALGINNTGQEQITISTSDGTIIDQATFDNANLQGISLNRIGDLNFTSFIAHDKLLKSVGKYSPGQRIDESSFTSPPQEGSDQIKGSSSSSGLTTSSSSSGKIATSSGSQI